jgi:DCN1-like protein 4/5
MAPKRKRAQDLETPADSTRATRSSTRTTEQHSAPASSKKATAKRATSNRKTATSKQVDAEGDGEAVPLAKKTRNTDNTAARIQVDDDRQCTPNNDAATTVPESAKKTSTSQTVPPPKPDEPYTPVHALSLFQKYADHDDLDVIGPEGFTQLCTDAQIPMDGALPLILAWQLGATEMGKFTKDQWVRGTNTLQISSLPQLAIAVTELENLLILDAEPVKSRSMTPMKKKISPATDAIEPYDRTLYRTYVSDRKNTFSKLYTFCFGLAKQAQARNIDMETATAFWSVLLAPQYTIIGEVIVFINEKGTYKGANKDLWNMMLEFCQNVNPTLEDYEADGAWPT